MTADNYRRSNRVVFWVYMIMYLYQFVTLAMSVIFTKAGIGVYLQFIAVAIAMGLAVFGFVKYKDSIKCGALMGFGAAFMYLVIMIVGKLALNFVFALPMLAVLFLYQNIRLMTRISTIMGIAFAIQMVRWFGDIDANGDNLFIGGYSGH